MENIFYLAPPPVSPPWTVMKTLKGQWLMNNIWWSNIIFILPSGRNQRMLLTNTMYFVEPRIFFKLNFTEKLKIKPKISPRIWRNQRWRMWSIKRRGNEDEENGYDEERKDALSSWIWCIDISSWSPNIRIGQVEVLFSR